MTSEEFIRNLKLVSVDNGVKSVFEELENPTVQIKEHPEFLLSEEFDKLDIEGKLACKNIAIECSKQTLYNVLLVLDGLLAISSENEKPDIELIIRTSLKKVRMNDPDEDPLSNVFKDIFSG